MFTECSLNVQQVVPPAATFSSSCALLPPPRPQEATLSAARTSSTAGGDRQSRRHELNDPGPSIRSPIRLSGVEARRRGGIGLRGGERGHNTPQAMSHLNAHLNSHSNCSCNEARNCGCYSRVRLPPSGSAPFSPASPT